MGERIDLHRGKRRNVPESAETAGFPKRHRGFESGDVKDRFRPVVPHRDDDTLNEAVNRLCSHTEQGF